MFPSAAFSELSWDKQQASHRHLSRFDFSSRKFFVCCWRQCTTVILMSTFKPRGRILHRVLWRLAVSHCSVLLHRSWLAFDVACTVPRASLRTCFIWTSDKHFYIALTMKPWEKFCEILWLVRYQIRWNTFGINLMEIYISVEENVLVKLVWKKTFIFSLGFVQVEN